MFGRPLKLFRLLGFDIKVDISWVFLAGLITWSLGTQYFPLVNAGFDERTYWIMGGFGALGLFASIIFHELAHSVVARAFGMRIKGITLFIFGGVAELEDEPPSAAAEFLVAIAGPIASIILSWGAFRLVKEIGHNSDIASLVAVLSYLAVINLVLAVFNMLPAFPLDGGRAFRALLWGITGNMRRATLIAARVGSFFGLLFMAFGAWGVLWGQNVIGGIWWILIGLFLRGAAGAARAEDTTRRSMQGEPVARFMIRDPVTVSPDAVPGAVLEDTINKTFHDIYPVTDEDGFVLGLLHARAVARASKEQLMHGLVRDIMEPVSTSNIIAPDLDAVRAINLMNRTGNARLLVAQEGRLVGLVTLRDLLWLLELKLDLDPRQQ